MFYEFSYRTDLNCTSHNLIIFGYKISCQRVVHCYTEYDGE